MCPRTELRTLSVDTHTHTQAVYHMSLLTLKYHTSLFDLGPQAASNQESEPGMLLSPSYRNMSTRVLGLCLQLCTTVSSETGKTCGAPLDLRSTGINFMDIYDRRAKQPRRPASPASRHDVRHVRLTFGAKPASVHKEASEASDHLLCCI
jgi:hypothetical protein